MSVHMATHSEPLGIAEVQALAVAAGARYGLVYAPGFYALLRQAPGEGWTGFAPEDNAPQSFTEWDALYEARLFSAAGELRWLREGVVGRAWWLGAKPGPDGFLAAEDAPQELVETDDDVLLWGTLSGAPVAGWSPLAESRFGRMWVPVVAPGARHLVLGRKALWAALPGDDGNLTPQGSRLTGFAAADEGSGQ